MNDLNKRTKIVATVGPASSSKEMLLQLINSGVNVFRINFSHGDHESHTKVIKEIQKINEELGYNISVLQDLQGPKIRIGVVENNAVEITPGQMLTITTDDIVGSSEKVSTAYKNFPHDVKIGESVLVDDGRLQLEVISISGSEVVTKVIVGGILKSKKGMNLPDTNISEPCLTKKDLKDLELGLKLGVDWIAISFVRHSADIISLRDKITEAGKECKIVAKIERPEAIKNIDRIIEVTDAIMIARGDLGIETEMTEVPVLQKSIIKKCNEAAKPVIVATQMLESMVKSPIPTRAEVNDVAVAVIDGVDGVMLSEESAAGQYPLQAVQQMSKIIKSAEKSCEVKRYQTFRGNPAGQHYNTEQIIQSAVTLAETVNAKAIIGQTLTGMTALLISHHRPNAKIYIFSRNKAMVSILNLIWGVKGFHLKAPRSIAESTREMERILIEKGLLETGDKYVKLAAIPPIDGQRTNVIILDSVGKFSGDHLDEA
jgi:pyruvate kinase